MKSSPAPVSGRVAVTPERFQRLVRLLQFLAPTPRTRAALIRRLRQDVRGFYRDLELLRSAGIRVTVAEGRYTLDEDLEKALRRLPFPDPHLTLGEALQIARGRTIVHRKLKEQIDELMS